MDIKYIKKYQKGKFKAKNDLYERRDAPSKKAPSRLVAKGAIIDYGGWVENGELFKGSTKWYFDLSEKNFYWAGNCEIISEKASVDSAQKEIISEKVDIKHPIKLICKQYYGPKSPDTLLIRDFINDEFHHNNDGLNLQCVEYVYYRLKCAGINVEWTRKTNRHGGLWPEVVNKKYKILNQPVVGGVMCIPLTEIPKTGHIAFVEKVGADGVIDISEANWMVNNKLGYYSERRLPSAKWKDRYTFIDFTI